MSRVIDRLGWVTARAARGYDLDEPLALAPLHEAGVEVDVVDWDDETVDWASYDRVLLRSPWDYPERLTDFLSWMDKTSAVTDVRNTVDMVRWSIDKHYLADLADAGVPVTPTVFVEPGHTAEAPAGDVVVKPAVGAGGRDAASYGPDQERLVHEHVTELHRRGATALVQPMLASIAEEGEWPMVFLDGEFSHAANKRVSLPRGGPVHGRLFIAEEMGPHVADDAQLDVARAAMELVSARFGAPTYARVDLVRDDRGLPCVLEVELVEPSLFLTEGGPEATARLVEAVTAETRVTRP
jgi:glutathione synthase/RimK-type ligase-like ATP-grasp enzyme